MAPRGLRGITVGTQRAIVERPRLSRATRNPDHSFQLRVRPWQLQPFMLAPVVPGDTMKNLMFQARAVSRPIKAKLVGWWAEFYVFYVKHRDLDERDDLTAMMLDLEHDMSGLQDATPETEEYAFANSINWSRLCLKRVVEEYFINEGDTWNGQNIGNLPICSIGIQTAYQSAMGAASFADPDVGITVGVDDEITTSEIDAAFRMWEFQRMNNITPMDYEDWLKSQGVGVAKAEELHKPELLRFWRQWTYPTNTVEPTTGVPSSAVAWSMTETANKDRFFKEPGFIFGVCTFRPKVYGSRILGSAAGMMQDAISWLPEALRADAKASWIASPDNAGPLGNVTDATGYVVDIRDLFQYGDQFVNFSLSDTAANLVALPDAGINKRYATGTMADSLFSAASPQNVIDVDGIVKLSILSPVAGDTSP